MEITRRTASESVGGGRNSEPWVASMRPKQAARREDCDAPRLSRWLGCQSRSSRTLASRTWMPTFDAENQVRYSKQARPFVSVSRDGELLPAVRVIARAAVNL